MTPAVRQLIDRASVGFRRGLAASTVAVGVLGGLVGAAYVALLQLLERVLGPSNHTAPIQALILIGAGLAVAAITRVGGETGNVELLVDNIHVLGGAEDVRGLRTLIPSSLLCVAAGSTLGPEAPLVQTTGAVGTLLGTRTGRDAIDVRVLTITGMAAGFTVLFGAPLGAAFFALEILHRRGLQYYEALLPAVVGSLCGYGVYLVAMRSGMEPIWHFEDFGPLGAADLLIAAGIGLVGALGAGAFAGTVGVLRMVLRRVPATGRYVLGGAALGALGLWSPYALTFGEAQLNEMLDLRLTAGALAVALSAKFLGASVSLAAGWKGGFIVPLFFIGATAGQLAHLALPGQDATVLMACAMVALCVGVTKTPIGATLVVTEMAGLSLLPVVLVAAIVALVATDRVTLIETQRARPADVPANGSSIVGDPGSCDG